MALIKMVMKISNYTGTADTFTWPYNPLAFDDTTDSNYSVTKIGFQKHHILVSGGGIAPKSIIMTGHFSGASKRTHWNDCSKHFMQTTQLKKLYYESDKFHLGIGKQIKRTEAGGRTNFIDYVATFEAIVGVLFGDTARTSGTNEGNSTTFVIGITGTYDGSGDVVIKDALGNEITIAAAIMSGVTTFEYKLVEMVNSGSGIYLSEYAYVELDGTQTKSVQTTDGFGILQIAAAANVTTIDTSGSNLTSITVTFRDGYVD